MRPQELDQQSNVNISRWVELNSQECRDMDDSYHFTQKCVKIGFEDGWMIVDAMGRLWGKGKAGEYFPFHFTYGNQNIGYRISAKAAN